MFIPKINVFDNKNEVVAFMQRFSFATIITAKDNLPIATHLPFLVRMRNDKVVLSSHFAKANPQWKDLESQDILVIFTEPHAYISPKHYDKELSVPTWNYISVHAYGKGKLVLENEKVMELLENTIDNYEESYRKQWDNLPEKYKIGMAKGIIGFEITVTDLQAKKKLSQNKKTNEQQRIIESLTKSDDSAERMIADYMKDM